LRFVGYLFGDTKAEVLAPREATGPRKDPLEGPIGKAKLTEKGIIASYYEHLHLEILPQSYAPTAINGAQ
jgi:hypothetical protein